MTLFRAPDGVFFCAKGCQIGLGIVAHLRAGREIGRGRGGGRGGITNYDWAGARARGNVEPQNFAALQWARGGVMGVRGRRS